MKWYSATRAAPTDWLRGAARWREAPTRNWNDFRGVAARANPVIGNAVFMVWGTQQHYFGLSWLPPRGFQRGMSARASKGMYSLLPKEQGF